MKISKSLAGGCLCVSASRRIVGGGILQGVGVLHLCNEGRVDGVVKMFLRKAVKSAYNLCKIHH